MKVKIFGEDELKKIVLENRSLMENDEKFIHEILRREGAILCESVRYKLYDRIWQILDDNE